MPPLQGTFGQVWINQTLPEDLRNYNRVLDKNGVSELLQQVAEKYPEKYRDIAFRLSHIGHSSAYTTGGFSVGLSALRPTIAARRAKLQVQKRINEILSDPRLSEDQLNDAILEETQKHQAKLVEDVYNESRDEDNPLAQQLIGAGRGNKFTLNSLRGADLLYVDSENRPIPVPVLNSYSHGLDPAEYFAGAFGARKGTIDVKSATQDAGFLAKQLVQVSHRLLVSADDDDEPHDEMAAPRGLPVDTDDSDSEGSLLAKPIGGYGRNTQLTPKILRDLKNRGFDQILVRSPIVGGPADGGVYAKDVGIREKRRISPIGDYVGISAAQALAEPVTQSQLSSKHSGGVAGATAGAVSGFKRINALIQAPKVFPGGATHAQIDGTVHSVVEAPQGGHYVTVDSKRHYVPAYLPVTVKRGDEIEAGDVLSEGTPNPAEIVQHKGVGEGRRYFMQAFRHALRSSGTTAHRRNIELLARGLINHVRLTDEVAGWVPDDVVPYTTLERNWQPRSGSVQVPPASARGQYLERPVLHYSVGTKVGRSVLDNLKKYGVNNIEVHRDPPPFEPEMVRGMANVGQDPDWMTRNLGGYQEKNLLRGTARGDTSDESGTSFVPALARGENFGLTGQTKGWDPKITKMGT